MTKNNYICTSKMQSSPTGESHVSLNSFTPHRTRPLPKRGGFRISTYFQKKTLIVPSTLLKWAAINKKERVLAVFLILKRVYRSGHFHSLKVPEELGISRTTYWRYLKELEQHGFIRRDENGFTLVALNSLTNNKYNKNFRIPNTKKIGETVMWIRKHLLGMKLNSMVSKIRDESFNRKKLNKFQIASLFDHSSSINLSIGVKKLSAVINRSTATVQRFTKRLARKGIINIKKKKRELFLKNIPFKYFELLVGSINNGNFVYDCIKGNVYKCYPNIYEPSLLSPIKY